MNRHQSPPFTDGYAANPATHVERHVEVGFERVEERVEGPAGGVKLRLLLLRKHLGRVAHLGPRLLIENTSWKQVLDGSLQQYIDKGTLGVTLTPYHVYWHSFIGYVLEWQYHNSSSYKSMPVSSSTSIQQWSGPR